MLIPKRYGYFVFGFIQSGFTCAVAAGIASAPFLGQGMFISHGPNSSLHPPVDPPRVAAREIAVAGERPERKIFRITVVAQVEHARKPGRGIARVVPESVGAWAVGEILDAARDRRMIERARRDEPEHRPGGLRGSGRRSLVAVVIELVARAILAPAAVGILN